MFFLNNGNGQGSLTALSSTRKAGLSLESIAVVASGKGRLSHHLVAKLRNLCKESLLPPHLFPHISLKAKHYSGLKQNNLYLNQKKSQSLIS